MFVYIQLHVSKRFRICWFAKKKSFTHVNLYDDPLLENLRPLNQIKYTLNCFYHCMVFMTPQNKRFNSKNLDLSSVLMSNIIKKTCDTLNIKIKLKPRKESKILNQQTYLFSLYDVFQILIFDEML